MVGARASNIPFGFTQMICFPKSVCLYQALLPKLLSGELRVQDAAEQVEAVG